MFNYCEWQRNNLKKKQLLQRETWKNSTTIAGIMDGQLCQLRLLFVVQNLLKK